MENVVGVRRVLASMGPQLDSCGRVFGAAGADDAGGFNGAAT